FDAARLVLKRPRPPWLSGPHRALRQIQRNLAHRSATWTRAVERPRPCRHPAPGRRIPCDSPDRVRDRSQVERINSLIRMPRIHSRGTNKFVPNIFTNSFARDAPTDYETV